MSQNNIDVLILATAGRRAYEGYCASSDNKSLISGQTLPTWDDLVLEIQSAWIAAAKEAVLYALCETE